MSYMLNEAVFSHDYKNGLDMERYAQTVYKMIGSRWTAYILYFLSKKGAMRFGELQKIMPSITHKVLSQQLKELEIKGLVERKDYQENPPKVEYFLTSKGTAMIPIIRAIGGQLLINGKDYSNCLSEIECPLEKALKVFSGKWKTSILVILSLYKEIRYNQIKAMLNGITDKYLTTQLKALERDGLISRVAYMEIPPRTEYTLTQKGEELLSVIETILLQIKQTLEIEEGTLD